MKHEANPCVADAEPKKLGQKEKKGELHLDHQSGRRMFGVSPIIVRKIKPTTIHAIGKVKKTRKRGPNNSNPNTS